LKKLRKARSSTAFSIPRTASFSRTSPPFDRCHVHAAGPRVRPFWSRRPCLATERQRHCSQQQRFFARASLLLGRPPPLLCSPRRRQDQASKNACFSGTPAGAAQRRFPPSALHASAGFIRVSNGRFVGDDCQEFHFHGRWLSRGPAKAMLPVTVSLTPCLLPRLVQDGTAGPC
jgi:hypothetical protein